MEGGATERQFSAAVDRLPLGRKHILEQELLKRGKDFNGSFMYTIH